MKAKQLAIAAAETVSFRLLTPRPPMSVFIVGCGHTGTTILARILAEHPHVFSVLDETGMFLKPNRIFRVPQVARQAVRTGRPVFVEKTPRHVHHVERIKRAFPNYRLLVTLRDGRDVTASLLKRYGEFDKAFLRWIRDTEASLVALSDPHAMRWQYESFVENPEASIRAVCEHIGLSFNDSMLDYHAKPRRWGMPGNKNADLRSEQIARPIFDGRNKWQTTLSADQLALFETQPAADLLRKTIEYGLAAPSSD